MQPIEISIEDLKDITARIPVLLKDRKIEPKENLEPGEWTSRELLGHLIDSASNNHLRFVNAIVTGEVHLPSYEQEKWVMSQGWDDEPWERLVVLWENYNLHLVHLLGRIPEDKLNVLCYIGKNPPMTLQDLVVDYLDHLKHHLKDLAPEFTPTRPSGYTPS
ncbi:MAG: DinB family protein [Chloroflexi bacterium]|nr:DinB family protein [Chloroflexota bacterium]OJV87040.1 MAG: hypothetical protein BGO39_33290 [Chloroflexi bacterium 54-19]